MASELPSPSSAGHMRVSVKNTFLRIERPAEEDEHSPTFGRALTDSKVKYETPGGRRRSHADRPGRLSVGNESCDAEQGLPLRKVSCRSGVGAADILFLDSLGQLVPSDQWDSTLVLSSVSEAEPAEFDASECRSRMVTADDFDSPSPLHEGQFHAPAEDGDDDGESRHRIVTDDDFERPLRLHSFSQQPPGIQDHAGVFFVPVAGDESPYWGSRCAPASTPQSPFASQADSKGMPNADGLMEAIQRGEQARFGRLSQQGAVNWFQPHMDVADPSDYARDSLHSQTNADHMWINPKLSWCSARSSVQSQQYFECAHLDAGDAEKFPESSTWSRRGSDCSIPSEQPRVGRSRSYKLSDADTETTRLSSTAGDVDFSPIPSIEWGCRSRSGTEDSIGLHPRSQVLSADPWDCPFALSSVPEAAGSECGGSESRSRVVTADDFDSPSPLHQGLVFPQPSRAQAGQPEAHCAKEPRNRFGSKEIVCGSPHARRGLSFPQQPPGIQAQAPSFFLPIAAHGYSFWRSKLVVDPSPRTDFNGHADNSGSPDVDALLEANGMPDRASIRSASQQKDAEWFSPRNDGGYARHSANTSIPSPRRGDWARVEIRDARESARISISSQQCSDCSWTEAADSMHSARNSTRTEAAESMHSARSSMRTEAAEARHSARSSTRTETADSKRDIARSFQSLRSSECLTPRQEFEHGAHASIDEASGIDEASACTVDCVGSVGMSDTVAMDRTTIMLRNLPSHFTRDVLIELLDREGFNSKYDFVYLPTDFKNWTSFGYVFVNCLTPAGARDASHHFHGLRWSDSSKKECDVVWSGPQQGLDAHVARFRNSPVMHESVPDIVKPVLYKGGVRVAFPAPTKRIRMPRVRGSACSREKGLVQTCPAKAEGN